MDLSTLPLRSGAMQLRSYQLAIAESALRRGNTLIVLPTALGKTYIAALIIAAKAARGERALFLAPTRPLVEQQARRFRSLLSFDSIAVATGEIPLERRREAWCAQIVCATPQIALADLKRGALSLNYSLVVFDEVHRLVKNYAYVALAALARRRGAHLIGLTASPGAIRQRVEEICRHLNASNVELRDERDADVTPYVERICVEVRGIELSKELKEIRQLIQKSVKALAKKLQGTGLLNSSALRSVSLRRLIELRERLVKEVKRNEGVWIALMSVAKAIKALQALSILESSGVSALLEHVQRIKESGKRSGATLLRDEFFSAALAKAQEAAAKGIDHPKITTLKQVVAQELKAGKQIIIFAHYRSVVDKIVKELSAFAPTARLVGKAGDGMSQSEQIAELERFRQRKALILVASSIGEEGIDVPSADLVICFDAVPSEIRLIQRRGRVGRIKPGRMIALITKSSLEEGWWNLANYKKSRMERLMTQLKAELESSGLQKRLGDWLET